MAFERLQRANDELERQLAASAAELQTARRENHRLFSAVNSAATGVILADPTQPDAPIVFVNDAFCAITGYPREEILGRNCRFLQGPDTDPVVVAQMRTAQAERRPFRGTLLNYRKDSTPFWNGLTINPVFDEADGLINFVGVQVDLTVRVEELETVRRSEAQLALAQRVARLGSWEQRFTTDAEPTAASLHWSDETFRIFGHTPGASANAWGLFENGVHPDDRVAVYAAYEEAIRTRQDYCLDHRIVRPDGTERVVHEEADFIFDQGTGRLLRVVGTVQDITERTRTEMMAVHLAAIVESSEDAIISKTPEGIITSWNRAAEAVYGYTEAEALSQSCLELLIPSDRREEVAGLLHRLGSGERLPPFETTRLRKGGIPIVVSISMSPVVDAAGTVIAVSSISRDITERKQAELSRARLAAIVDSSADAIVGQDLHGIVTSWNAGAERIFGYSESEMINGSILPVLPPGREDEDTQFLASARRGERLENFETVRRTKVGMMIDVSISVSPIRDAAGHIVGVSKIARDITERKQVEAARHAKDEAEHANLAKSRFLSRMSHELRTPLNAILGFGQLLEISPHGEDDGQCISQILKGGRHLLSMIDEVLDLARVEAGELTLKLTVTSLGKLMQECTGLVSNLAQARGITCTTKLGPACRLPVRVDELRLRQVLLNLLSNAIKYDRVGGQVTLSCQEMPGGLVRCNVEDSGPGISPEGLARLFVPFERLGQELTSTEGSGLGLVVSRRLAEAMRGTVSAESRLGAGSTFWVELPVTTESAAPEAGVDALSPAVLTDPGSATVTVLYVEDNPSNQQVIKTVVERLRPHWRLLLAADGVSGLQTAREQQPDVVLLDLELPGMKGDAVLAALRADAHTSQIPVLLLSADATAQSRQRLLALGAEHYVSKPFNVAELLDKVDSLSRLPP